MSDSSQAPHVAIAVATIDHSDAAPRDPRARAKPSQLLTSEASPPLPPPVQHYASVDGQGEAAHWYDAEPALAAFAASASRITIPLAAYRPLTRTPTPTPSPAAAGRRPTRDASPLVRSARAILATLVAAPALLALGTLVWAGTAGIVAILRIVWLALDGDLAAAGQAGILLNTSSRLGFLALGDVALACSLVALFAGLSAWRRARLFAIPGGLLTATSLALLLAAGYLAWPALGLIGLPQWARILIVAALSLDALAVGCLPWWRTRNQR